MPTSSVVAGSPFGFRSAPRNSGNSTGNWSSGTPTSPQTDTIVQQAPQAGATDKVGASVEVAPGEFMPGSRVEHRVRGVDGTARGGMTVAREADGGISLGGEFPGAHSLHVVTLDASGGVVSQEDYEGEGFFRIINGGGGVIAWGPCLNGEFPHWYETIELLPYPQLINGVWTWYRYVWAFGCTGNWSSSVRVEVYPQYEGEGVDLAAGTLELRSSGPAPSFDVAHVVEELPQATVRGLGEAILASGCEDGGQCADPALRRVRSSGIGSSGQDGVMITGKAAGPLTYQVDGTDLCAAGATIAASVLVPYIAHVSDVRALDTGRYVLGIILAGLSGGLGAFLGEQAAARMRVPAR